MSKECLVSILGWCFYCQREMDWEGGVCHTSPRSNEDPRLDYCGPVWPGVRVRTQADFDRLVPKLLAIEKDIPGHFVEWVPGSERIDCRFSIPWTPRVRWLRIAADPDGPPIDIEDVRAVVAQCREAGVPVWIEALDWPDDLQCRELPGLGP